jgi:hypothetical protein
MHRPDACFRHFAAFELSGADRSSGLARSRGNRWTSTEGGRTIAATGGMEIPARQEGGLF